MRLIFALVFTSTAAFAAPVPGTSSSRAIAPYWGLYQSPEGFSLDSRGSKWKVSEIPAGAERADAAFRIPVSQALLTIRIDETRKAKNPKSYMDGWMTLYHRLGFDILGTRPFEQNGDTAYVIDMVQRDRSKQARQAIFFRGPIAVIINCNDELEGFKNSSLAECNKVIRSFRWTRGPTDPAPKY